MRMGGVSWWTWRPLPLVTHTRALFADQSHSIPDNLVALLGHCRAWNCSNPERVFGSTSGFGDGKPHWNNIHPLKSFGNRFPQRVFTPVTQNRWSARYVEWLLRVCIVDFRGSRRERLGCAP